GGVRRCRGVRPVRAREHRRPRAHRLHRPDVGRAVTVVARSEVSDGVALVELDDPGRYNALTTAMVGELRAVLADLRDDRTVRAVVLAARWRGFCAGANMTGDDTTPPEAQDRGPVGAI